MPPRRSCCPIPSKDRSGCPPQELLTTNACCAASVTLVVNDPATRSCGGEVSEMHPHQEGSSDCVAPAATSSCRQLWKISVTLDVTNCHDFNLALSLSPSSANHINPSTSALRANFCPSHKNLKRCLSNPCTTPRTWCSAISVQLD